MTLHRFDRADLPATPWKNGGGMTCEIVCMPSGAGLDNFDWRISIAHIASDSPFSAFPGVDRVITLLEGNGVHLLTTDGTINHRLAEPLIPFTFAGEAKIQSRLLGGDCQDFNVMTRRSRCRAAVQVLHTGKTPVSSSAGLLLAMNGNWQVQAVAEPLHRLLPQQGLWWHDQIGPLQALTNDTHATALCVSIHPVCP